ncbi:hypothetical protein V8E53_010673 [Lactarius tabidus]
MHKAPAKGGSLARSLGSSIDPDPRQQHHVAAAVRLLTLLAARIYLGPGHWHALVVPNHAGLLPSQNCTNFGYAPVYERPGTPNMELSRLQYSTGRLRRVAGDEQVVTSKTLTPTHIWSSCAVPSKVAAEANGGSTWHVNNLDVAATVEGCPMRHLPVPGPRHHASAPVLGEKDIAELAKRFSHAIPEGGMSVWPNFAQSRRSEAVPASHAAISGTTGTRCLGLTEEGERGGETREARERKEREEWEEKGKKGVYQRLKKKELKRSYRGEIPRPNSDLHHASQLSSGCVTLLPPSPPPPPPAAMGFLTPTSPAYIGFLIYKLFASLFYSNLHVFLVFNLCLGKPSARPKTIVAESPPRLRETLAADLYPDPFHSLFNLCSAVKTRLAFWPLTVYSLPTPASLSSGAASI